MEATPTTTDSTTKVCQSCKKSATSLRRGLCRACYLRAWRGTELPLDACCATCVERRHMVLRWTKLGEDRIVTCQNCGFLADRLRPRPVDLEDLKLRLSRERRQAVDRRRNYVIDPSDPDERRVESRRRRRRLSV